MDLGLGGKVAVVAAASSGLGYACAHELAAEGCSLVIGSRNAESISRASSEISEATGAKVLGLVADMSSEQGPGRLVEAAIETFGGLDVVVANAGGPAPGGFDGITDPQWQDAFDMNFLGTVRLIRAALPSMRARGGGRISVIVSSAVREPIANLIASNAIRPAVVGLLKTLASEIGREGVLVNAVAPGRIATGRVAALDAVRAERAGTSVDEIVSRFSDEIAVGRYGTSTEFGKVVAFLSSWANSYVTGTTVMVDGGLTRGCW